MSNVAERAVAEARNWIGTPYQHQASCKGAGTDCLGLLRGVWRALYGAEPEAVPAYSMDWSEPAGDELLWRVARRHLVVQKSEQLQQGDILLFRMRDGAVAKHLGLMADVGKQASFIHAFSGHAVVESPMSLPWRRRIVARFQFPREL